MRGKRPLSVEEASLIAEKGFTGMYATRDRCIFQIGIYTGYRIGTILSLKVKDLIKNGKVVDTLVLKREYFKGKRKSIHKPLSTKVRTAVEAWYIELQATPTWEWYCKFKSPSNLFFFQSREGANKPIGRQTANLNIQAAAVKAGIDISNIATHSMRKTAAMRALRYYTEEYRKGKSAVPPMMQLKEFLGHEDISSTLSYISFMADDLPEDLLDV